MPPLCPSPRYIEVDIFILYAVLCTFRTPPCKLLLCTPCSPIRFSYSTFSYSPFSSSPYSLLSPRQGRPRVVHCSLLLFVTSPISPLSLLPGSGAAALPVTNVAKTQKKKKHTSTRDHHAPRTAPKKGTHCASRANSEGWTPATFWLAFPFRHKKRRSINRKVTTMREDIYTKMFNPP